MDFTSTKCIGIKCIERYVRFYDNVLSMILMVFIYSRKWQHMSENVYKTIYTKVHSRFIYYDGLEIVQLSINIIDY